MDGLGGSTFRLRTHEGAPAPAIAPPPGEWVPPRGYGRDVARLALVDPHKAHLFYEVSPARLARGRGQGRDGALALRLQRLDRPGTVRVEGPIDAIGAWYFAVESLAVYVVELGWRGPGDAFEVWLASNELRTPRTSPNPTARVRLRARGAPGAAGERDVSRESFGTPGVLDWSPSVYGGSRGRFGGSA